MRGEAEYETDFDGTEIPKHSDYCNYYSPVAEAALLGLYALNSPNSLLPLAKRVSKIKASTKGMKTQSQYT